MFVEVIRLLVAIACTAAGFWLGRDVTGGSSTGAGVGAMLGTLVGYLGGGLAGRWIDRGMGVVERRVARLPGPQVLAGILGLVAGAFAGLVVTLPLVLYVRPSIALPISGIVVWCGTFLGFRIAASRSEELFAAAGLSTRPLVRATPFDGADGYLVDTSAVMDGQLLPFARSGVLRDDLMVPRFVLDELQGFADAGAGDERARRARRGLEALEMLKHEAPNRLYVLDDEVPEVAEVDAKLVALARKLQLRLLTNDATLARVAEVQGIPTLSLRRLAADLAPEVVAGQPLQVALTKPGRHDGQGVGFLDDGSMVVVNGGLDLVGHGPVAIVATSVVPTSAGRIVFARPAADAPRTPDPALARSGE